jgi:phosphotransferase system enzyme I (PtsP)
MSVSGPSPEASLLLTLEEISRLVSHSHHPGETLTNIVQLIQGRFHTDVCSVYLLEAAQNALVLGATVGLRPEGVGRVRMRLEEGLTGLVAEKLGPVMVEDAFRHPRFKFFPEAGEEPYHSFLGVPLIEGGTLQGVLVVQTREPRTFSANEMRMLVAVAAQLAPLVTEANLLEQVTAAVHGEAVGYTPDQEEAPPGGSLQGKSLSPGTGMGQAYYVDAFGEVEEAKQPAGDPARERQRLAWAIEQAREEILRLSQRISTLVGEDHGAILQGQLMILQDSTIEQDLAGCLGAGESAEGALLQTLHKYVEAFQRLANPFFQERVYDVKDVFRRILWYLRPGTCGADSSGARLVLVAHEASVMDLFSVDLDRLAAVVVEHGGPQSHAAILARSLGIPMVGQVAELVSRIRPGRPVLVDGTAGTITLDPAPAPQRFAEIAARPTAAAESAAVPEIPLGLPRLEANVNLLCEAAQAHRDGASGVGLYRSEFLFLARRTLPTEDEQLGIYRKLLLLLRGQPVTLRTFDLRPDKLPHSAHFAAVASQAWDWRLVLESPPMQQLFKGQIRAILRAATAGPARILVPLVTRSEQLDFVLDTVDQARDDLRREGLDFAPAVPVGIMIEVAAATAMIETWAPQVGFFALGTNDLMASALGIDREDPVGAGQCDPLHPGFLRILHHVVESAHQAGRRVTVCGEMASDPEGSLVLSALRVDAVSVAVPQLAAVRAALATQSVRELTELAPRFLCLRTASQVRELIQREAIARQSRVAMPLSAAVS